MNVITMIAVLVISLLFTIVFVVGLKSRGPWRSGWTFFTIVTLWLAAVSLWIPPAGPVWMGVPWIDLFVTGLLVSFVLSATSIEATSSSSHLQEEHEVPTENPDRANTSRINKASDSNKEARNRRSDSRTKTSNATAANRDTIESSLASTLSTLAHESLEGNVQALRAGGFFWMLLLCLCALIIIGAN